MPLRQDGSGGSRSTFRSTRAPTSIRPKRTSYHTELEGTTGPGIHFRPARYPRSALGTMGAVVLGQNQGKSRRCELRDVSRNGLAFEWAGAEPPTMGELLEEVVSFDGHEAYRGRVRVCSLRLEDAVDRMVRYSCDGYARSASPYDAYAVVRDVAAVVGSSVARDLENSFDLGGSGWIQCVAEELNQAPLGGTLTLETEPGKGSELIIRVPSSMVHEATPEVIG